MINLNKISEWSQMFNKDRNMNSVSRKDQKIFITKSWEEFVLKRFKSGQIYFKIKLKVLLHTKQMIYDKNCF
jgi:hypothetical protein